MCSGVLCVRKKIFLSLERSDYQCSYCESTCKVRNFPFKQQTISFFLKSDQGIYIFGERQKLIRDVIGVFFCHLCPEEKCVHRSTNNNCGFYDCKKCQTCSHVLNILCTEQKRKITLFGGDGAHCFAIITTRDYETEKQSPFCRNSSASHNHAQPNLCH